MRIWQGIRADTAPSGEGAMYLSNATFYIEGELARRAGMEKFSMQSGRVLADFSNVMTGRFVLFATSSGTVEAVVV